MEAALQARELRLRLGETSALRGLELHVEPGERVGLLGGSGSGKTAVLRAALGLVPPDRGTIQVLGLSPRSDGPAVRARLGWIPDEGGPPGWMTAEEAGDFAGGFYEGWDRQRYVELLEELSVPEGTPVATFSRGSRTRLMAALALARRPELLLLDDPPPGPDEEARLLLRRVGEACRESGATMLLAARAAAGMEEMLDSVAVLHEGRCVGRARCQELRNRFRRVEVHYPEGLPSRFDLEACVRLELEPKKIIVVMEDFQLSVLDRLRAMGAEKVDVFDLTLDEAVQALASQGRAAEAAEG